MFFQICLKVQTIPELSEVSKRYSLDCKSVSFEEAQVIDIFDGGSLASSCCANSSLNNEASYFQFIQLLSVRNGFV